MLIRFFDGHLEQGILLHAEGNAMRVAFPGREDTSGFTLHGVQWFSETGEPVEIDFIAGTTENDWRRFCEALVGLDGLAPWDADSLIVERFPTPAAAQHPPS
jgi:hypothetical protein